MEENSEDDMLSTLKEQYQRDIEQDVSAIESVLDSDEEQPEIVEALPAPDYDSERTTVEEALLDTEMENFSEKNVIEHNSIEGIGNHLKSASIVGDIPSEVSFDPPSETTP
ncbi:MAG: hypothetical protein VXY42_02780 [Candidatus Thermoplasmatota archaeon]|nr:hypothetical protein [Candidatus Thermoplasmatota archaeon]